MPDARLTDPPQEGPKPGIALCLSGGGYRAMVFHLGSLVRLNEAGLLPKVSRISSVSGGSITAGVLGMEWKDLTFDRGVATNLDTVIQKVLDFASVDVDAGSIISGLLLPGAISDRVARAYDKHLFQGARLADLPGDDKPGSPRFVINATNVKTGVLWRFSSKYMGDYRVGLVNAPDVALTTAVTASSAFPPVLSPLTLEIEQPYDPEIEAELTSEAFRKSATLSDGGVYDNLGLETAHKNFRTLLVSDGGQKIEPQEKPAHDWARHSLRVLDVIDSQVRSLRKRNLIDSFKRKAATGEFEHSGTYWGIRTHYKDYELAEDPLGCAGRDPTSIADTPTRLEGLDDGLKHKLVNWGYAVCDAALRKHFSSALQAEFGVTIANPKGFPFAGGY